MCSSQEIKRIVTMGDLYHELNQILFKYDLWYGDKKYFVVNDKLQSSVLIKLYVYHIKKYTDVGLKTGFSHTKLTGYLQEIFNYELKPYIVRNKI